MKPMILIAVLFLLSGCSTPMLMKNCDPIVEYKYLLGKDVYDLATDNSEQDYRCYTKMPWE